MPLGPRRWGGGCNLPLERRRLRRPWPFALLHITSSSVVVRPLLTKLRWEIKFGDVQGVEQIQLSVGKGVRLTTSEGAWYFYTYEAGFIMRELARRGITVSKEKARLRFPDLPR